MPDAPNPEAPKPQPPKPDAGHPNPPKPTAAKPAAKPDKAAGKGKPAAASPGLTGARADVLAYLAKRKATTPAAAVPRKDVWDNAGGPAVTKALRDAGLIARDDRADGTHNL